MIQAILLSILVVAICTAIHYGTLKTVSDAIARGGTTKRGRHLALTVGAVTAAHVIEALVYTAIFLWAARGLGIGELNVPGPETKDVGIMDYFYFSLVNFTTLGRGDLNPDGHLRFITGIEAFHGFLMITASGSFMLQVMGGKAPLTESG
ncbi:ion channel [Limimaricola sp. G21655-S1]|uniref:ion channel n=1 Tax=Limimaricola sp. G21655-S1 TaxID=3014768 RepID=UPI0022AF74F1|nr:ion channel [Limimaricola sp. G21655-S1]MCZ4260085.1 ion channel [Limimaricola sp. G21655-S1]